ncbi:MAG: nucleotidyltransferase domain-containing protein [Verrucomicrobiota bacterium]|nr:nucleotidyltransferase domain-containing protein [Verrucomicrobiota bacterium]
MRKIDIETIKSFLLENFEEIEIAYIFGSAKDGVVKDKSDVDIALFLKKGYDIFLEFTIADRLESLLNEKVDITILNKANPVLSYEVLRNGVRLFEKNHEKRAFVELCIFKNYLDNEYYLRKRNG